MRIYKIESTVEINGGVALSKSDQGITQRHKIFDYHA